MKARTFALLSLVMILSATVVTAQRARERFAGRRGAAPQATRSIDELDGIESWSKNVTLPPGARVVRDVAYGSDENQRFDVYIPEHAKNAPVIFMVHGGGWRRGDKAMSGVVQNKIDHWLPKGFIFISSNYRMVPDADALEQGRDVARAIAFAQSRARTWGGDPARFILMGHSAGAHLVALVSTSRALASQFAKPLATVILDSGALDVPQIMESRHFPMYDNAFGSDPQHQRDASPYHQLTGAAPPMLAVCSTRREISCEQSNALSAKGRSLGVRIDVLPEDLSHMQINKDLGESSDYTEAVDRFIGVYARR